MRGLGTAAGRSINLVSMPSQMAIRLMLFSVVLGLLVGCRPVFAESTRRIYAMGGDLDDGLFLNTVDEYDLVEEARPSN